MQIDMDSLFQGSHAGYRQQFWQAGLASFVVCGLLHVVATAASPRIFRAYNKLSKIEQLDWITRYIQVLHGIVVPTLCYILLLHPKGYFNAESNKVLLSFPLSSFMMGASGGCFIYETMVMLSVFPKLGGYEMLLHHVASLTSVASGGLVQRCHYFIMSLLCMELTNAFICMRWYLDRSGLRNSKAYILNGIAMFVAWIPARLLVFWPFYVNFVRFLPDIFRLHPVYTFYMFTVPPLLLCLNVFWFTKIARGLVRVVVKGMEATPAGREDSSLFAKKAVGAPPAVVTPAKLRTPADDAGSNGNGSQGIGARWESDEDLKKLN